MDFDATLRRGGEHGGKGLLDRVASVRGVIVLVEKLTFRREQPGDRLGVPRVYALTKASTLARIAASAAGVVCSSAAAPVAVHTARVFARQERTECGFDTGAVEETTYRFFPDWECGIMCGYRPP